MKKITFAWLGLPLGFMTLSLWLAGVSFVTAAESDARQDASKPAWKNIYRHSSGITFHYPDRWKVDDSRAAAGYVGLTADDSSGPPETIMVSGSDANGITSPDDALMELTLDQIVKGLVPYLKRSGKTEVAKSAGRKAAIYTWEGKDGSDTVMRARVYVLILNTYAVSVTAFGTKTRIEGMDARLRQILDTISNGGDAESSSGGNPSDLAGVWKNWEYKAIGSSSVEKTTFAALRADGSFIISSQAESAHSFTLKNSTGDEIATGGRASTSTLPDSSGKWTAASGKLTLRFQNGEVTEYQYEIKPNSSGWPILYLRTGSGGKAKEWSKVK